MNRDDLSIVELKKALARLREALALTKTDVTRDSVIQRFEFTVELSWKVLRKTLLSTGLPDPQTPKNAFREAAKAGFPLNPEDWIKFLDDRNLSSHTYRDELAERVYLSAKNFPPHVDVLITEVEAPLK